MLAAMPLPAQAPGLAGIYAQIRAEETNNSKIMWIIHEIADVHGPRVTGTPNLKACGRLGGPNDELLGIVECPFGTVDVSAPERRSTGSRLGKYGAFRRCRYALSRTSYG